MVSEVKPNCLAVIIRIGNKSLRMVCPLQDRDIWGSFGREKSIQLNDTQLFTQGVTLEEEPLLPHLLSLIKLGKISVLIY